MTKKQLINPDHWNANLYQQKHQFVWEYGTALLELLHPQPQERILDLGCGTGELTAKIATSEAKVLGLDNSAIMLEQAKQKHPHLEFLLADATNFTLETAVDAVFSNAVLHWIKPPETVITNIHKILKSNGRLVVEFGGKGNVQTIRTAIQLTLEEFGYIALSQLEPMYFPSIGEYTTLLENHGFDVTFATLFDRPTPLEDREQGMENWLTMFGDRWFSSIPQTEQQIIKQKICDRLQPLLYQPEQQTWFADYRRLRIVATKSSH